MKSLLITFMIIVVAGCSSPLKENVSISTQPPNLEIVNDSNRPIFYIAIEENLAARIYLTNPCDDYNPNLEAKSKAVIPYEDIYGIDSDSKNVWVMWTDCKGNSEYSTLAL
jgi:hypothetical protein